MIRVALVRGAYLNQYEAQNFNLPNTSKVQITGISSRRPLHKSLPFKTKKFFSPADIVNNKSVRFIANRTVGDLQVLLGLENEVSNFDIFHTADPHYYYSYQLAKLRHEGKIRMLLATSWETIPSNNESTHAKKVIKKFTEKNTDFFICPTQRAKETLIAEGVSSKRIILLPYGVDLKRFGIKNKAGKKITTLFVGRLVEEKGVGDLIEAFEKLSRDLRKQIKLKIVGEGPLKKMLQKKVEKAGLAGQVSFIKKRYEDMPSVYKSADILVVPSKTTSTWEEQFGMVVVEGLASGLPIIAYSSGALPEVLSDSGIFVREGNISALTMKLSNLITNPHLRARLGKIARRRAERHFDSKKVAKKLQNIYETLGRNTFQK